MATKESLQPFYERIAAAGLGVGTTCGLVSVGGNWAVGERIVNLSYFTPYAYGNSIAWIRAGAGWTWWRSAISLRRAHLAEADLTRLVRRDDRCCDANWVWFGVALADGWITPRTPSADSVAGL